MNNQTIFTPDSLNIFTDASIKKLPSGETIGCAGCILVFGELENKQIWIENQIIRNTTNNNSEIKAIRLGVKNAIEFGKGYKKKVRLFSDSQISIFGLRDRIHKWKYQNGTYLGVDGKPIKNQEVFLEIVHTILENNFNIEFYHQKGHVQYNSKSLYDAMHVFAVSNNIRDYNIDIQFIKQISMFNNDIDELTGDILKNINYLDSKQYTEPIYFEGSLFDRNRYLNLIRI